MKKEKCRHGSLRGVVWRKKVRIGLIKGLGNRVWPKTPKILVFKEIFDFWDYRLSILLLSCGIVLIMGPLRAYFNCPIAYFRFVFLALPQLSDLTDSQLALALAIASL